MAIISSAQVFKPDVSRLTEHRITLVMKYVAHCYLKLISENKKYPLEDAGKIKKEDYLRNGIVDDYLKKKENKIYYKEHLSDNPLIEIYFQTEENQTYTDNGVLSDDYIDISIKETKLSEFLGQMTDDEIKFAVECKRINTLSDCKDYVGDTLKFANRKFVTFRLPFEGQIAFVENDNLKHEDVAARINEILKSTTQLTTEEYLIQRIIHESFECSYTSEHRRTFQPQGKFRIFHLFFDYSKVVA